MSEKQPEHLILRAIRGEHVERAPVWAMRQAGRWDPEFQKVRKGLSFFEFSARADLAAEASLCPKRFGVDAIILFYDITTIPYAMGLPFELKPHVGPMPHEPIRTLADVEKLFASPDEDQYRHILDLLDIVKKSLKNELPILAFAGAPFTVATYCIGTGKEMDATRRFAAENSVVWQALLEKLQGATIDFLNMMSSHGAAAYQLFDSWAGGLTETEYDLWAQPYHQTILAGANQVPRILFVKEGPYLDKMVATKPDAISLGRCHSLKQAKEQYPEMVYQGNVDSDLLQTGTVEEVKEAVFNCLTEGAGHHHILNLNHGVDKSTPVENFAAYVRAAKGE
ncbi:MAG: uroporphyrinogen decarboxylase family protein [Zavarzinella sp.]